MDQNDNVSEVMTGSLARAATSFSDAKKAGDRDHRRIYATDLFSSWMLVSARFLQGVTVALRGTLSVLAGRIP
jgi:hypothetical protein